MSLLLVGALLSPVIASAGDENYSSTEEKYKKEVVVDDYTRLYNDLKNEFYKDLAAGKFEALEKRLAGYNADIEYLSQNAESEHYKNIEIYRLKAKALQQLRQEYSGNVNQEQKREEVKKQIEAKKVEMDAKREEVKKKVEEHKAEMDKKKEEMKKQIDEKREDWQAKKAQAIAQYKKAFQEKVGAKLNTMSYEEVEKVLKNVENSIQRIEKLKISQERKDKILHQLYALKELLVEKIDSVVTDEIDLEELFRVE